MSRYCPIANKNVTYLDCQECYKDKLCEYFFLLIAGSRSFDDYKYFSEKVDFLTQNKQKIFIISGGAKGTDSLAERYATEKGFPFKKFPANWNTYGKSAGFIRNEQMHQYISRQSDRGVLLFWDGESKGTKQNIPLAKKYHNQIKIIMVSATHG